jgi:nucleotide-binding universal stress UspA family protein
MKRILFPTDFSEAATNAFIHALQFAKIVQGELVLLHAFDYQYSTISFSWKLYDDLRISRVVAIRNV